MTMIMDYTISSLGEYVQLRKQQLDNEWQNVSSGSKKKHQLLVPERPRHCQECGKTDCFWVHSYWYRWAIEGDVEAIVPVPRFECSFCAKVVSVLYAFLAPYRQFTVHAMAEAVETYISEKTSYRKVAGELAGENYRPAHSQVWQWVMLFVSKVQAFLGVTLQRACVDYGKEEEQLIWAGRRECPNAENAASLEKATKLSFAARTLAMTELLLNQKTGLICALQTYFVQNVQCPRSILTGRSIRLFTPQSLKPGF